MEHIYREHSKRKTETLNGDWKFCPDYNNEGKEKEWFKKFPDNYTNINVPGCWNFEPGLFDYFGTAWYKKEFHCNDCFLQIEFGAISGLAEVYLDGEQLGEHYGGWSAFSFSRPVRGGVHTLVLSVDVSSNSENTIPLQRVDWYHYGGITRSVRFTEYSNPFIEKYRISYDLDETLENADLNVQIHMANLNGSDYETPVNIYLDNELLCSEIIKFGKNPSAEIKNIKIPNIRLWNIGKPELYKVTLETADDDVTEQIGFRKIEVRGNKAYLNGNEVFFKGINRHEEHPDWGFAMPANLQKRDVGIIKDLGCNIVRGSHYPNSHTFLDYLDREGIMFWSEIPMWGFPDTALADPLTLKRGLEMHREMIEQYYHHPSIVIWGLHNEIYTYTNEGYALTKKFNEFVRKADNSRLVTFATCYFEKDICLEFADIIAINNYSGWYCEKISDWERYIADIPKITAEHNVSGKPVVLSEFGGAALAGYSNFSDDKWTMQYQAELIEKVITLAKNDDNISGTFVWQFADMRSDKDINRARCFNNKGILDEYRRPKFSYYTVKKLYS